MQGLTRIVETFPTTRIPSQSGGLPVEVSLIAQLGHGAGDQLFAGAMARQRAHESYVDALDEPSARLGGVDLDRGDASSLYSFGVGAKGHPFHRHAGHRVFTAISGSSGARLRFSTATLGQIDVDPRRFLDALRHVDIPPDCVFTMRFGGGIWHQFMPLAGNTGHPAFFALSCHTNELGGALPEDLRRQVLANEATIPALTETLPSTVVELLEAPDFDPGRVPTVALSLDAPAGSRQSSFCQAFRGRLGRARARWQEWRGARGYRTDNAHARLVVKPVATQADSLLRMQFPDGFDHEDNFLLTIGAGELPALSASAVMAGLLEGFVENNPAAVARMMAFRNVLVKPFGLRTSPLGCPVSSLLGTQRCNLFAGRFPVIDRVADASGRRAQVILGADDKHLRFRSCVGVEVFPDRHVEVSLGTRVSYRNLFGRIYMAAIDRTHRTYVSPTLMRTAAVHAIASFARTMECDSHLAVPI